ncbi:hypothetical protein SNEBB_002499 [Seison nebaliae]|nr:hypothetical protein SNEBB_002499 [Seison nebaliae]
MDRLYLDSFSCQSFKERRSLYSLESIYKRYPLKLNIAYSIVVHKEAVSFDHLLSLIWHPQNVYCVHIDNRSSEYFKQAVRNIVSCFENVFLSSTSMNIYYGHISRLYADIRCFNDLLDYRSTYRWEYIINLCGMDLPLHTQNEISLILSLYNGRNDVEGIKFDKLLKKRITHHYRIINEHIKDIGRRKKTVKYPSELVKGSAYGAFSLKFVQFIFSDNRSKNLLRELSDTFSPDETFWATLNFSPRIPGGSKMNKSRSEFNAKYVKWTNDCKGQSRHGVCVFGIGDANDLLTPKRTQLFANKFLMKIDYNIMECMKEHLLNRIRHMTSENLEEFEAKMTIKVKDFDFLK